MDNFSKPEPIADWIDHQRTPPFFGRGLPFLSAILKLRLVIKRQPIYPNYNIDERLNACTYKCRSHKRKADLGMLIF